MSFTKAISQFNIVSAHELDHLIRSGQPLAAFIGRETCPYCQRFAPKLAEAQAATGARVYFVDSSNASDPALQAFRDKFSVVTVPGLVVSDGQSVKVVCDSSLPVEEIKALIG